MTEQELINLAKNNLRYELNQQYLIRGKAQVKTAGLIPKTGLFAENEDLRPSDNTGILKIGVSQSIAWPGLYTAQKKLYSEQLKYYDLQTAAIDIQLKRELRSAWYQLWYLQDKQELYRHLDSIFQSLSDAAVLKVKTGDSPGLDSIAANVRLKELQAMMQQLDNEIQNRQHGIMQLLNSNTMRWWYPKDIHPIN